MKKRTKKAYLDLFNNPSALFGPGTQVILFPNGSPEIWINNGQEKGYIIKASGKGKVGFGLEIHPALGCKITVPRGDGEHPGFFETSWLEICQYNLDDRARRFRDWYFCGKE